MKILILLPLLLELSSIHHQVFAIAAVDALDRDECKGPCEEVDLEAFLGCEASCYESDDDAQVEAVCAQGITFAQACLALCAGFSEDGIALGPCEDEGALPISFDSTGTAGKPLFGGLGEFEGEQVMEEEKPAQVASLGAEKDPNDTIYAFGDDQGSESTYPEVSNDQAPEGLYQEVSSAQPQGGNPADAQDNRSHTTTMEDVLARLHETENRRLTQNETLRVLANQIATRKLNRFSLTRAEAEALGEAVRATHEGDLELALEILADNLVTAVCYEDSWALATQQLGINVAVAPLVCATAGFWPAVVHSSFDWLGLGQPAADDAWWTVQAAESALADGNSLAITYHRYGAVDHDYLGNIGRGDIKTVQKDLDWRDLFAIEVKVVAKNDVCVQDMAFQIGRQTSGAGRIEKVALSTSAVLYITAAASTTLHYNNQVCIFWGDEEGAVGNFKFHWPSALQCQRNFGVYLSLDYAKCLTWAMYHYDVRRAGDYVRWTFNGGQTPLLPTYFSDPMNEINPQNSGSLCFDLKNFGTTNFNTVNLIHCNGNSAQRFDFDHDGRLRSAVDPTKCVEAGSAGTLYQRLYIYDCHGGDWQRWTRYTSGRIRNNYHGKYIGLSHCSVQRGTPLVLRWYETGYCGDAQKWIW